jgi:hypothetical protein
MGGFRKIARKLFLKMGELPENQMARLFEHTL